MAAFLRKLPNDEIYNSEPLCKLMGCTYSWLRTIAPSSGELAPHTLKIGNKRYWGSVKAIAELTRRMGK